MEVGDKLIKYVAAALAATVLVGGLFFAWKSHQHEQQVLSLQNEIAKRDTTIEVQKDVYAKLAVQVDELKDVIDTSTKEGKALKREVERSNADILALQNVVVKLKEQVAKGQGKQTDVAGRKRVEFEQDFGYARVDGFTLTDPPEFELRLGQGSRPLKLQLVLTQQEDKSWRTLVSSSDPTVAVDIGITGVNPRVVQLRWWETFRVRADMGMNKQALLAGLALTFDVGRLTLGPGMWATTAGDGQMFYGGTASWQLFKR